jgi:hypothetical protein
MDLLKKKNTIERSNKKHFHTRVNRQFSPSGTQFVYLLSLLKNNKNVHHPNVIMIRVEKKEKEATYFDVINQSREQQQREQVNFD